MTHQRLSVHNVTFYGAPLTDLAEVLDRLGVIRLSILDEPTARPGISTNLLQHNTYQRRGRVPTCSPAVDSAGDPQTRAGALSTGDRRRRRRSGRAPSTCSPAGRVPSRWAQAAERFCDMIAPCAAHAQAVGRGPGDRVRLQPLRRHSSRSYAARHHHAGRDERTGYLHRRVPLLGRSRCRRRWCSARCRAPAHPVERLRARRPAAAGRAVPGDGAIPLEASSPKRWPAATPTASTSS